MYCRGIENSQLWNAESTNPAGPHTRLANISINACMWGNEGLVVAFIKKRKVMRAVLPLIAETKNGTKKTYCNPKSQWETGNVDYRASHGISQTLLHQYNLSSFDGLKIQMSHDRFFGGETGSVCSETISRSTTPQRDYISFQRVKAQRGEL